MGLYAIGDLHLHFGSECRAAFQRSDPAWKNHEALFLRNCRSLLGQEDTLVLQYCEEADPIKAAFGYALSAEDWESIAEIKDVYGDVLFTAPLRFASISPNADGLFRAQDFLDLLRDSIEEYNRITEEYELADAA